MVTLPCRGFKIGGTDTHLDPRSAFILMNQAVIIKIRNAQPPLLRLSFVFMRLGTSPVPLVPNPTMLLIPTNRNFVEPFSIVNSPMTFSKCMRQSEAIAQKSLFFSIPFQQQSKPQGIGLFSDERSGACTRNCQRPIETRFGIHPAFHHVQGHLGDPGNELVDTLASDAITNAALTPCHDWLQQHTRGTFANLSAWFWMLFAVEYNGLWNGPCIEFPQPVTQPDTAVIEGLPSIASHAAETIETAHIHVRCATCNDLSLCGSRSSEV